MTALSLWPPSRMPSWWRPAAVFSETQRFLDFLPFAPFTTSSPLSKSCFSIRSPTVTLSISNVNYAPITSPRRGTPWKNPLIEVRHRRVFRKVQILVIANKFGTSGFLYRSNKLMFDEQSKNLWSTLEGKPVVGSLVGSGLRLRSHPLVTTTWGEWKSASRHHGLVTEHGP